MPRSVWVLGLVSFFMDTSSETIHALLPLFLTTTLGVSVAVVGLIDGVAESTAAIAKVFSGYLSDKMGKRKPLILFGYGLAAVTKPLFALAGGPLIVFAARFVDRIGKGVRGAPRDALIADVTSPDIRGRAFGLRQAMDTAGAFAGPLLAIALMALLANDMRAVFWVAAIPAALAVLCVLLGVEDSAIGHEATKTRAPLRWGDLRLLKQSFWVVVSIGIVLTLARFSEAFLVLKAHAEGLPLAFAPLVLVTMNLVYALGAYPAGALSDRVPPATILLAGVGVLIGADFVFAFTPGAVGVFLGVALWGGHMALTQGLLAKLIAEVAPAPLRGSAFGIFNLMTGVALLFASLIAGVLWDQVGAPATFLAGASFAGLAGVVVFVTRASICKHDA